MNNNDDVFVGFVAGVILTLFLGAIVIFGSVKPAIDESWKEQIAAHGCGGYYLDADSNRQWDWANSKKKDQK